ncbi:MAG: sigma 54-interacting transcriptional regulator [Deltaproteobacteria bacterium]
MLQSQGMSSPGETVEQTGRGSEHTVSSRPGAVSVLDAGRPSQRVLEVPRLGLELGRGNPEGVFENDERVSRRHVQLSSVRGCWGVTDLESRNGTYVNGERVQGYAEFDGSVLVRLGNSLIWAVPDVTPYGARAAPPHSPGAPVIGGLLRRAWEQIEIASRAGDTLLIRGESGSGKELAARHLHEICFGAGSNAPFIAVNCAAIPEGLAERLLFGAKRGAYSGAAADAPGYIAAADGGTLFLDELAELDPLVQAKLLRVLETREVLPLGDARPRPVQIRVCAATHENLREAVSTGRFRQDLYFRLGRPEVILPPLRERIDELPWLIQSELQRTRPECHSSASFVEACALRPWPGNVRELLREVRLAAHVLPEGTRVLLARHLSPDAGRSIEPASVTRASAPPDGAQMEQQIETALSDHQGNVTRAAKALGLHRNQLRRWLSKRSGG